MLMTSLNLTMGHRASLFKSHLQGGSQSFHLVLNIPIPSFRRDGMVQWNLAIDNQTGDDTLCFTKRKF